THVRVLITKRPWTDRWASKVDEMPSEKDGYSGSNARQAAARRRRLDDFTTDGAPRTDAMYDLLCEDLVGTYPLPFPCRWVGGVWRSAESQAAIEGRVVGWRFRKTA